MKVRYCLTGFLSVLEDDFVLSVYFPQFLANLVRSCEELKSLFFVKIFEFRHCFPCAYENMAWQKGLQVDHPEHVFPDKKDLRQRDGKFGKEECYLITHQIYINMSNKSLSHNLEHLVDIDFHLPSAFISQKESYASALVVEAA